MTQRPARLTALCALLQVGAIAQAASVTGSVNYRERMALPPDAALEVTIEDISIADAPAQVIGYVRRIPAGQVPIAFEVTYDKGAVRPGHRYGARARITVAGRLMFTTTRTYPVLMRGTGSKVEMMLQRVNEPAPPDRTLPNTYWKLSELNGASVRVLPKQREPHMILQSEGSRLIGSGGCNRMTGTYRLDESSVSFSQVASTMMACSDGMDQESLFFGALEKAVSWKIRGDTLELMDDSGATIARFVAVDLK
jgi:putative lipoprotein